jgi:hypothetical protein
MIECIIGGVLFGVGVYMGIGLVIYIFECIMCDEEYFLSELFRHMLIWPGIYFGR